MFPLVIAICGVGEAEAQVGTQISICVNAGGGGGSLADTIRAKVAAKICGRLGEVVSPRRDHGPDRTVPSQTDGGTATRDGDPGGPATQRPTDSEGDGATPGTTGGRRTTHTRGTSGERGADGSTGGDVGDVGDSSGDQGSNRGGNGAGGDKASRKASLRAAKAAYKQCKAEAKANGDKAAKAECKRVYWAARNGS